MSYPFRHTVIMVSNIGSKSSLESRVGKALTVNDLKFNKEPLSSKFNLMYFNNIEGNELRPLLITLHLSPSDDCLPCR